MNVSLNKLSSLIPDTFKKQMFDKGITRVDKIKTVDIAIAYVEHLQLICKAHNIKEDDIKINDSISIPVANNNFLATATSQAVIAAPTKISMKNLNNLNLGAVKSPSTSISASVLAGQQAWVMQIDSFKY